RSVLAKAVFDAASDNVETIFGDELVSLIPTPKGVRAKFRRSPECEFDLVIGAGGLHSRVRALAFGEEQAFSAYLGYKVAALDVRDYRHREENVYVAYAVPGRQAARFSLRNGGTLILLVIADDNPDVPGSDAGKRAYLHEHFDDVGWECPEMMA